MDVRYRFCIECGTPLDPEARFCGHCGFPIDPPVLQKRRRGLRPAAVIAGIVSLSLILTTVLAWEPITRGIARWRTNRETTEQGDAGPGSKPVDVSPAAGLRIVAAANALDKDRTFKAEKLDEDALHRYAADLDEYGFVPMLGYDLDAGMKPDEIFPGSATLSIDLEQSEIPEVLWSDLEIIRIDEDGTVSLMNTTRVANQLTCQIRRNCVFLTGSITFAFGLTATAVLEHYRKHGLYDDLKTRSFRFKIEYDPPEGKTAAKSIAFQMFWPTRLGYGNQTEVERLINELHKALNDSLNQLYPGTDWRLLHPFQKMKVLALRDQNAEYKKNVALLQNEQWIQENVLPKEARLIWDSLQKAAKYLYGSGDRGFRVPAYAVDVLLFDVPVGDLGNAYALQKDLVTMEPFIMVNVSDQKMNENNNPRVITNNFNLAIVHELFHVTQKGYFSVLTADKLWFLEATAILLEKEAVADYENRQWSSPAYNTTHFHDIDDHWETMAVKMHDDPSSFDAKACDQAMYHGYVLSRFLEYQKNNPALNSKGSQLYLRRVMEAYSGLTSGPFKALYMAGGISEDKLCEGFKAFCLANLPVIQQEIQAMLDHKREQRYPDLLKNLRQVLSPQHDFSAWGNTIKTTQPLSVSLRQLDLTAITSDRESVLYMLPLQKKGESAGSGAINAGIGFYLKTDNQDQWQLLRGDLAHRFAVDSLMPQLTLARLDSNLPAGCQNPYDWITLVLASPDRLNAFVATNNRLLLKLTGLAPVWQGLNTRYARVEQAGAVLVFERAGAPPLLFYMIETGDNVYLDLTRDRDGHFVDVSIPDSMKKYISEITGKRRELMLELISKNPLSGQEMTLRYAETALADGHHLISPLSTPIEPQPPASKRWVLAGEPVVDENTDRYSDTQVTVELYEETAIYESTHWNYNKEQMGQTIAYYAFTPAPRELIPGKTVKFKMTGMYMGTDNCRVTSMTISTDNLPFVEFTSRWYLDVNLGPDKSKQIQMEKDLIIAQYDDDMIEQHFKNKATLVYRLNGPNGSITVTYHYVYR
jgi:hypothetical protein